MYDRIKVQLNSADVKAVKARLMVPAIPNRWHQPTGYAKTTETCPMRNWTLKAKIASLTAALLLLLAACSGISVWGLTRQAEQAEIGLRRMKDAESSNDVITLALRSYQNQADTIINGIDGAEFGKNISELDAAIEKYGAMADTADEKAWTAAMRDAAKAFAANYRQEVLPRVQKLV